MFIFCCFLNQRPFFLTGKIKETFIQHQQNTPAFCPLQNPEQQLLLYQDSGGIIGIAEEHHIHVFGHLFQNVFPHPVIRLHLIDVNLRFHLF